MHRKVFYMTFTWQGCSEITRGVEKSTIVTNSSIDSAQNLTGKEVGLTRTQTNIQRQTHTHTHRDTHTGTHKINKKCPHLWPYCYVGLLIWTCPPSFCMLRDTRKRLLWRYSIAAKNSKDLELVYIKLFKSIWKKNPKWDRCWCPTLTPPTSAHHNRCDIPTNLNGT